MTTAKPKLERAPNLPLEKVEWRIDGEPYGDDRKGYRCRWVPYMNVRDAADLLDEWVGPADWQDQYDEAALFGKPVLWAALSIRVGDEWVTKRDVGVPSNFEAQKGGVSDAFKRVACIKWGVGRNVYDLPTIWAPCGTYKKKDKLIGKESDKTLPHLLKELKRLGFNAKGGRVAAGGDSGEAPGRGRPGQSGTAGDTHTGELERSENGEGRGRSSGTSTGKASNATGESDGNTPGSNGSAPSDAPSLLSRYKLAQIVRAADRCGLDVHRKSDLDELNDEQLRDLTGALEETEGAPA